MSWPYLLSHLACSCNGDGSEAAHARACHGSSREPSGTHCVSVRSIGNTAPRFKPPHPAVVSQFASELVDIFGQKFKLRHCPPGHPLWTLRGALGLRCVHLAGATRLRNA